MQEYIEQTVYTVNTFLTTRIDVHDYANKESFFVQSQPVLNVSLLGSSSKYQLYSLWFDRRGNLTSALDNLSHSRRGPVL